MQGSACLVAAEYYTSGDQVTTFPFRFASITFNIFSPTMVTRPVRRGK